MRKRLRKCTAKEISGLNKQSIECMFFHSAFRFVSKTEFDARIEGNTDDIGVLETELQ